MDAAITVVLRSAYCSLARSKFPEFLDLGKALQKKLPQEQRLVTTYCQWMAALSALQLPIFEEVLSTD